MLSGQYLVSLIFVFSMMSGMADAQDSSREGISSRLKTSCTAICLIPLAKADERYTENDHKFDYQGSVWIARYLVTINFSQSPEEVFARMQEHCKGFAGENDSSTIFAKSVAIERSRDRFQMVEYQHATKSDSICVRSQRWLDPRGPDFLSPSRFTRNYEPMQFQKLMRIKQVDAGARFNASNHFGEIIVAPSDGDR